MPRFGIGFSILAGALAVNAVDIRAGLGGALVPRDFAPKAAACRQGILLEDLLYSPSRNSRLLLWRGYNFLLSGCYERLITAGREVTICSDESGVDPKVIAAGRVLGGRGGSGTLDKREEGADLPRRVDSPSRGVGVAVEPPSLLMICLAAFIAVFAVLGFLAAVMRALIKVFPDKPVNSDAALLAAITTAVSARYPGARITRVEEVSSRK